MSVGSVRGARRPGANSCRNHQAWVGMDMWRWGVMPMPMSVVCSVSRSHANGPRQGDGALIIAERCEGPNAHSSILARVDVRKCDHSMAPYGAVLCKIAS